MIKVPQLDPFGTECEIYLRRVLQLAFDLGQEFHAASGLTDAKKCSL